MRSLAHLARTRRDVSAINARPRYITRGARHSAILRKGRDHRLCVAGERDVVDVNGMCNAYVYCIYVQYTATMHVTCMCFACAAYMLEINELFPSFSLLTFTEICRRRIKMEMKIGIGLKDC